MGIPLADLAPRLVAMAALLVCSGFFSGTEVALFSLTRGRRERLARSELKLDRSIAALLTDPRRLIVSILVGNELVNITFSSLVAGLVEQLAPGWSTVVATLAATAITVPLLLFFGEITPKSMAIRVAEAWSRFAARPLRLFMLVATPVRLVMAAVAGAVVRLLGGGAKAPAPRALGEAELKALVDAGSEAGELQATERRLIHRVFEFGDRTVGEIMTPARRVFTLSYDLPLARMQAEVARRGFSRVPVHRGRDEIAGILHAKDLLGLDPGRSQARSVKDLLHPPLYVPKKTTCDRLFREFQKRRIHISLVVDEYGRLAGVVTMDDLLEELFGEIRDDNRTEGPETTVPGSSEAVMADSLEVAMAAGAATAAAPGASAPGVPAASAVAGAATAAAPGASAPSAAAPPQASAAQIPRRGAS